MHQIAVSFNGRTLVFEADYGGSNPPAAAKVIRRAWTMASNCLENSARAIVTEFDSPVLRQIFDGPVVKQVDAPISKVGAARHSRFDSELAHQNRSRGGTGRRAGLRNRWLRPYRFDSCREHHLGRRGGTTVDAHA